MPRKKAPQVKFRSEQAFKINPDDPKYLPPEDRRVVNDTIFYLDMSNQYTFSEDSIENYYGQSLKKYEWNDPLGVTGLRWNNGSLYLENNPNLHPFIARGRRGEPGEYLSLFKSSPLIQEKIRNLIIPISTSPWRATFDENNKSDEEIEILKFQKDCFDYWMKNPEWNLTSYIESVLRTALVQGFALNEIVWSPEDPLPPLPKTREPSSIDEWILTPTRWLGVVQSSYRADAGQSSKQTYNIVIPAEKLVHTAFEPQNEEDFEGRSILRSIYQPLKMSQDLLIWQMACIEINSSGTIVIESQNENVPEMGEDAKALLEQHLSSFKGTHVPYIVLPRGWTYNLVSAQQSISDLSPQIKALQELINVGISNSNGNVGANGSGSYALKDITSKDSRDLLDQLALMMVSHFNKLFYRLIRFAFPNRKSYPLIDINYGQVENRDNNEYLNQVKTFIEIKDRLSKENQKLLANMLDLIEDQEENV